MVVVTRRLLTLTALHTRNKMERETAECRRGTVFGYHKKVKSDVECRKYKTQRMSKNERNGLAMGLFLIWRNVNAVGRDFCISGANVMLTYHRYERHDHVMPAIADHMGCR